MNTKLFSPYDKLAHQLLPVLTNDRRVLDVNEIHSVSIELVEAARNSLVIGQR
jgi:hypothetical protein